MFEHSVRKHPSLKMNSLQLFFVFALFLFKSAQSIKMCDPKDIECTTKAIQNFLKILAAGIDGLTDPLEPLHLDKIEGKLESVKYQLTNVTMTGFKDCNVKKFILYREESKYENDLVCPQINIYYNYEANENEIQEKGSGEVTAVNYEIKQKGNHSKKITGNDPVPHYFIVSHTVETIPHGEITIESKSYHNADKTKFGQILNNISGNWNEIDEKYLRAPIIEKFWEVVIKNVDKIIRTMRPEAIFPKLD